MRSIVPRKSPHSVKIKRAEPHRIRHAVRKYVRELKRKRKEVEQIIWFGSWINGDIRIVFRIIYRTLFLSVWICFRIHEGSGRISRLFIPPFMKSFHVVVRYNRTGSAHTSGFPVYFQLLRSRFNISSSREISSS